jgi:hypothetical protein
VAGHVHHLGGCIQGDGKDAASDGGARSYANGSRPTLFQRFCVPWTQLLPPRGQGAFKGRVRRSRVGFGNARVLTQNSFSPARLAQVLRAYDSRFRPTQRRPDVYGDPDIAPGAKVLCRVVDKHIAGKLPPRDEWLAFQLWDRRPRLYDPWKRHRWLWQFGGELLVIETDFHEGPHHALSPKEFIPVVAFLQKMHEKGYVHGDVRCANVVFGKCLIDFDLGGRVEDAPTYPDGYQSSLVDGSRLGRAGGGDYEMA